jgi:hypothetical protein
MIRVAKFRADMARDVLDAAKDAGDEMVIAACRRVRQAWLLAHKVSRSDLDLIEAFA